MKAKRTATAGEATPAKIMTSREVAKYLGISFSYLYKLTSQNRIPYYKPEGKKIYFDREEIEAWVKSNRIATRAEISDRANLYCQTNKF